MSAQAERGQHQPKNFFRKPLRGPLSGEKRSKTIYCGASERQRDWTTNWASNKNDQKLLQLCMGPLKWIIEGTLVVFKRAQLVHFIKKPPVVNNITVAQPVRHSEYMYHLFFITRKFSNLLQCLTVTSESLLYIYY